MIKISYKGGYTPKLFIDRLIVRIDLAPGEEGHEVFHELWPLFDDASCFSHEGQKTLKHVIGRKIVLNSIAKSKHYPYLQVRHAEKQVQHISLTLHPRDMGLEGLEELNVFLGCFVEGGWGTFVDRAKVAGIEVSIDFEGVPFNSVHVMPDQAKTSTVYRSGKQLQTVYFGKTKSNQTVIYDRGAKRAEQGDEAKSGDCTRIERKLKPSKLNLKSLDQLPNPFSHVEFVAVPPVPPPAETKDYVWALFTDSVAQRGLDAALKLLPTHKRSVYRKHLASHDAKWWLPSIIWKRWPGVLDDLKLTDSSPWHL